MTRTRRLLAGSAALLTLTAVASACDSSPFAASINGQVVKQTTFNAQLRALAGNAAYVKEQAESGGATVTGAAPGTYSAAWTASVLTGVITDAVVRAHLAATGKLPDQAQLDATRAIDELTYGAAWTGFKPAFQAVLVQRDADLAMVEPDQVTSAQLTSFATHYPTELASDVCVRTVAVPTAAQASATESRIEADPSSSAVGGALTCYTSTQLDGQPQAFVATVYALKTGKASEQKTAYGYQVTAVTSRTAIPAAAPLGRAVTVAINASKGTTPAVNALLGRAHVQVNPVYGTWSGSATTAYGVRPATAGAS